MAAILVSALRRGPSRRSRPDGNVLAATGSGGVLLLNGEKSAVCRLTGFADCPALPIERMILPADITGSTAAFGSEPQQPSVVRIFQEPQRAIRPDHHGANARAHIPTLGFARGRAV